jgi:phosphopantothenate-cysteine ligase/phosphopantothenoylcysteine decarboxylase/phosphopantothenate--cysteine ligase
MAREIVHQNYDVVIHSAAVSDYRVTRVYYPSKNISEITDIVTDGKISSSYEKVCIDLEPTDKIIDEVRKPWGFGGKLVKFKLEVGMSDGDLLEVANKSREASGADIMVANCKEWARVRAIILTSGNPCDRRRVDRRNLAGYLLDMLEGKR